MSDWEVAQEAWSRTRSELGRRNKVILTFFKVALAIQHCVMSTPPPPAPLILPLSADLHQIYVSLQARP